MSTLWCIVQTPTGRYWNRRRRHNRLCKGRTDPEVCWVEQRGNGTDYTTRSAVLTAYARLASGGVLDSRSAHVRKFST